VNMDYNLFIFAGISIHFGIAFTLLRFFGPKLYKLNRARISLGPAILALGLTALTFGKLAFIAGNPPKEVFLTCLSLFPWALSGIAAVSLQRKTEVTGYSEVLTGWFLGVFGCAISVVCIVLIGSLFWDHI
jgi:hypothetical protein